MFYSEKAFVEAATTVQGPLLGYCGDSSIISSMRRYGLRKSSYRRLFREVKQAIIERRQQFSFTCGGETRDVYIGKWFRPWDVVPALREFRPPAGDYGIGIEVEGGFRTRDSASFIIGKIANWKHIAVDYEGNANPAEVTFPPVLYSKFNYRSQACRYLQLLAKSPQHYAPHSEQSLVGTHVNVSAGSGTLTLQRVEELNCLLSNYLSSAENVKYFGRRPYGLAYYNNENNNRRVEYKMFNTVCDWRILRRYVDIAVSLTVLVCGEAAITLDSVREALEAGYNKNPIKENNRAA